jgi:hypothetical protein
MQTKQLRLGHRTWVNMLWIDTKIKSTHKPENQEKYSRKKIIG